MARILQAATDDELVDESDLRAVQADPTAPAAARDAATLLIESDELRVAAQMGGAAETLTHSGTHVFAERHAVEWDQRLARVRITSHGSASPAEWDHKRTLRAIDACIADVLQCHVHASLPFAATSAGAGERFDVAGMIAWDSYEKIHPAPATPSRSVVSTPALLRLLEQKPVGIPDFVFEAAEAAQRKLNEIARTSNNPSFRVWPTATPTVAKQRLSEALVLLRSKLGSTWHRPSKGRPALRAESGKRQQSVKVAATVQSSSAPRIALMVTRDAYGAVSKMIRSSAGG